MNVFLHPEYLLLLLEQGDKALKDDLRLFLLLANTTSYLALGFCLFCGVDTYPCSPFAEGDLASATPDTVPSPPSSRCMERMPEPTADGEPEPDPWIATEPELLVTSAQVCELATMAATREKALASEIAERSSTHCYMAEGELAEDLGLFEAERILHWDICAVLPPLHPPSSELSETAMPKPSTEWAPLPKLSHEEAYKCPPFHPVIPLPPLLSCRPSTHHQSSICAVGSPLVCQFQLGLQLEVQDSACRTSGYTMAPSSLLSPLLLLSILRLGTPLLWLHLVPLAPSGSSISPAPLWSISHLFHLGSLDPPRHRDSSVLCLGLGHHGSSSWLWPGSYLSIVSTQDSVLRPPPRCPSSSFRASSLFSSMPPSVVVYGARMCLPRGGNMSNFWTCFVPDVLPVLPYLVLFL
ncbi:hypothetical protein M9458_043333, partial [Cirrhinus mrigala]